MAVTDEMIRQMESHEVKAQLRYLYGNDERLLKEQQQHRRDRPQAGKQIKRIFFEQQGNENDDCGNPHEADADIEQTVDGALLRMMLLFVPQAETPDGIYQRQCQ